jgi:Tol biopolymer transport system component
MSMTILDGTFSDYRPAFSPDGERIVFERTFLGSPTKLWIHDRQTGASRPFLPPGTGPRIQTRPDWSFAGNDLVAFAGGDDAVLSIWIVKGDGTGCVATPGTEHMIYPSWYPDGEHLAVMVSVAAPYTARIDRSGKPERITPPSVYSGMPSVNQADGMTIAFAGQQVYGQDYNQDANNVWTFDPATPEAAPKLFTKGQGRAPWWSQDGSQIALESSFQEPRPAHRKGVTRKSPPGYAIYVAPATGGEARRLTDPEWGAQHPKFSRSGKEIVCALHLEPDQPQSPWRIGILALGRKPGEAEIL